VGVDVFNLFNFQTETAVDQNFTFNSADPCTDGTDALTCLTSQSSDPTDPTAPNFTEDDVNDNFGQPTAYQAARSIRFGAKVTF